jgi:hypothetical protein
MKRCAIRMAILLIPTLLMHGCASASNALPGEGVTEPVANRWGCDWTEMQQQIAWRQVNRPEDMVWVPAPGWSVCEVLAAVGAPDDITEIEEEGGYTTYTFWYDTGSWGAEQFKWLTLDSRSMTVAIVSWDRPWQYDISGAEGLDWGAPESEVLARFGEPDSRDEVVNALHYTGREALGAENVSLDFATLPEKGLQAVRYSIAMPSEEGAVDAARRFRSELQDEYSLGTWQECDAECYSIQEIPEDTDPVLFMRAGQAATGFVYVTVTGDSTRRADQRYMTEAIVYSSDYAALIAEDN